MGRAAWVYRLSGVALGVLLIVLAHHPRTLGLAGVILAVVLLAGLHSVDRNPPL